MREGVLSQWGALLAAGLLVALLPAVAAAQVADATVEVVVTDRSCRAPT